MKKQHDTDSERQRDQTAEVARAYGDAAKRIWHEVHEICSDVEVEEIFRKAAPTRSLLRKLGYLQDCEYRALLWRGAAERYERRTLLIVAALWVVLLILLPEVMGYALSQWQITCAIGVALLFTWTAVSDRVAAVREHLSTQRDADLVAFDLEICNPSFPSDRIYPRQLADLVFIAEQGDAASALVDMVKRKKDSPYAASLAAERFDFFGFTPRAGNPDPRRPTGLDGIIWTKILTSSAPTRHVYDAQHTLGMDYGSTETWDYAAFQREKSGQSAVAMPAQGR